MTKFSINLPLHRLDIKLVRRTDSVVKEALTSSLESVKNSRKGNKISRLFRHVFQSKISKRILGVNLAFAMTAAVFAPSAGFSAKVYGAEDVAQEGPDVIITTNRASQYPTANIAITQGYKFYHPALDLDGVTGDPIKPIAAGKVEAIQYSKVAYGNAIIVDHGEGITSLYAHLSKIFVEENQEVYTYTVLGEMGATGHASGDHLHLEVRSFGRPLDPSLVLPKN